MEKILADLQPTLTPVDFDPFAGGEVLLSAPATESQKEIWLSVQMGDDANCAFNESQSLRLRGQLDVEALRSSFQELVARHEALRTTFSSDGSTLCIASSLMLDIPFVDLSNLSVRERDIQLAAFLRQEVEQLFDLVRGPLFRVQIVRLQEREHLVILTAHHIVCDGWSWGVLVPELGTLYSALRQGVAADLKEPFRFSEYALLQTQQALSPEYTAAEEYWLGQFSDQIPVLDLPTDRPRPPLRSFNGARSDWKVNSSLVSKLKRLGAQVGCSFVTILLAGFEVFLHRLSGQEDIIVGMPAAGQAVVGQYNLVGHCVNLLPLRSYIKGEQSFADYLRRRRSTMLDAHEHQQFTFGSLLKKLALSRESSRIPLVSVIFNLDRTIKGKDLQFNGFDVEFFSNPKHFVNFEMCFDACESSDGLDLKCEYNTDLFDAQTIYRRLEEFEVLLAGIVADPDQLISRLPILPETEQQLLNDWNATDVAYPETSSIHEMFEKQVERSPDAIAVVFEDKQLTYRELNQRANRIAHHLRTLGVGSEVLVGICVERSLEMVVGLLGILKAGGAYVPLDPTYPSERLAYLLNDSQVKVLLIQEKFFALLGQIDVPVLSLDTDWGTISQESQENPASDVNLENLAYVIYTSGSTGNPKGVFINHHNVVRLFAATRSWFNFSDCDVWTLFHSYAFDFSVWEIFGALIYGGKLVVVPYWISREPEAFYDLLCQEKVTVLNQTPSAFRQLIKAEQSKGTAADLNLRLVIFGGEALELQSILPWFERHGDQLPQLVNMYGITETTVHVTSRPLTRADINIGGSMIGSGIPDLQVYILDQNLQPVPIGVKGEIHVGGAGLARGYLNRPDLSASKFIPNPFSDKQGSRLYKTGDEARYLSDGNIEYLGRIDNQVKIRGFRIEVGEIEAAIRQCPDVRETAVIAREDVPDHKYLVAYIVPNHSEALASSDLRGFLKEKLPDYMIPGAFVMLDALPLTPNGKVDRKALPIPDTARQELQAESAPRTRSEEILAQIWREVFHREFLSIHDNFFEVGGDSILSIQIISKANIAGLLLTPKQIFQHQTIAELAAVATTTGTLKAEQGLVTGSLPLTPIQHWFFAQNLPEPNHFNQAFLLEVPPTLNFDLLQQALQQLLLHHDALRLRFHQSEACWQQFNALPDETVPFSRIDLSTLQEGTLSQTIESTSDLLQASLNLNSGPLLRVALFHLETQKPDRLLLVIHHLAVDGVSWRILLEDLQTAYQQLESNKPIQLPPKTTSFKHWAEKLTQYAQSPAAKKELTYWSNISTPKITHLPVDYKGKANTKASARSVKVSLNPEETRALLQEIHKAYHTQINDILLTALVQVLATWSGSNSILIDLEGHGREEILPDVDLSRTVGWFTTIFPVLLELKAIENLPNAIQSTKEQLRAIPNRGIGYGVLRYLSGDAEITSQLSCLPQAEVSFNYLGQFDWGMQSDSFIKLASESVGPEHCLLGHRTHLLEINGLVVENQLQLEWTYSENFHSSGTIESLAQDFAQALRTLIAHCLSADAGDYTPDVFENQTLHSKAQPINNDQRQENNVPLPLHLLELQKDISELLPLDTESAYPIAKMQEFMLHHYVNDHQKMGVYHCQLSYDIYDENLNLNAFKKALEISVQKHPALRTVFITSNGKPTVQVVKKNLRFSINEQDISQIKFQEQENYLDAVIQQDRQNLFDIKNPNEPLFRFGIFHQAENRLEFLMSIHHAITDGWSNIEFINELYEIYSALNKQEEITVVPALYVYKEFVALEKEIIDSPDASSFWKLHLKDYTYKPLKPLTTSVEQVEAVALEYNFEEEMIADLRELCRKLRVSPKALFLSTYLDLIGIVMKSNRVCVGVVSNGRTERLSDPFGALGLFWNIVPFCQLTREEKGVQIKNVQQSLIDIEPYVRYPLLEILSDQQKPELFFATFNFVNFHNAKNINAHTGLKVNARKSHDKFNFPLNYAMSMEPSSGNISLNVEYDRMYFNRQDIRSMIQNYIEILKHTVHTSELY